MATSLPPYVNLSEKVYRLSAAPLATLPSQILSPERYVDLVAGLAPATVITWSKTDFTPEDLQGVCSSFSERDDVWSRDFLSTIILIAPGTQVESALTNVFQWTDRCSLPQGPFMICPSTANIFAVHRIFPDTHRAFLTTRLPGNGPRLPQNAAPGTDPRGIAVPSRLYYVGERSRPLAGMRFAVKDTIDVYGLRTGFGSRAYYETYDEASSNAVVIQELLDAGAVFVGKVKTSQFSEGTEPAEWTEYRCPFNARGDGYQKPSSSSTGSAAAAAAYSFLDFTVGTDTGGSIRHPAGINGIFGSRPTHSAISLSGVLGATDLFNTVGIFARSASTFRKVGSQLLPRSYRPVVPFRSRRYKLLYPVRAIDSEDQFRWFPDPEAKVVLTPAEKQMESFITLFEAHLDCERVPFNLEDFWQATRPKGAPSTLDEAIGCIYSTLTTSSAAHGTIDPFIADYVRQNAAKMPFIEPIVAARIAHGRSITPNQISAALESMQTFRHWVNTILLGPPEEDAIALMVFPQSFGRPSYRDEVPDHSKGLFNDAFSVYAFGYLCGCVDYTVPIGEIPFLSRITGEERYLPVSISMVSRPGNVSQMSHIPLHFSRLIWSNFRISHSSTF